MRKAVEEHAVVEAHEVERERKQKRVYRAKAEGPDALRNGKYPRCTQ